MYGIVIGLSQNIYTLWFASLITGICSIIPQIFVPIAAQYSIPKNKGKNVGMLGLCGIAGALAASFIGKYVKKVGVRRFNVIGCLLFIIAWGNLILIENHYSGIILGIILLDIGMQCIQLSNQASIFEICPNASSRINTIFITTDFIGGSLGTLLAGIAWKLDQWRGVGYAGIILILCSLLITICDKNIHKSDTT